MILNTRAKWLCSCPPKPMSVVDEKCLASGKEDYTQDGTVDLKGRPVLRSKTGSWKACSFILVYEMFERMTYYGISTNLVVYLSKKLHEGTVTSSNNVSNWAGVVWATPLAGAYIADAYLGQYWTLAIASCIYLSGMCLLTLAVSLPALMPPLCAQGVENQDCPPASPLAKGVFFFALYVIAIGIGGTKANMTTMGADQFDEYEARERTHRASFFNFRFFIVLLGVLFATTFLVYIQDNVGWGAGYGLPTVGFTFSLVLFLVGAPFYRHKLPSGSPITRMLQVFVAATIKWKTLVPDNPKKLHELSMEEYVNRRNRIDHTSSLRFLDKAAIKTDKTSPWMLCTVTQVEETKQMAKMIPILITIIFPCSLAIQTSTLFIKQGTMLDKRMGPHFEIPPAGLSALMNVFMLISIPIYDFVFVPAIRKYTKNPRGITMLQRLGTGLVMYIIIMVTAWLSEWKRLSVARENHLIGEHDTTPLTIFILLPQFALTGVADNFFKIAMMEFFYDQAPQGMKSLGVSYSTTCQALGCFLSSFLLSTVADITKKHGHQGWILDNLNVSHLDYYYAFMVALSIANFLCFLVAAKFFAYNVHVAHKISVLKMNPASLDSARTCQSSQSSQSTGQPDTKY